MGTISRRAADELKRTVQIVKGLAPKGAGFADPGLPIRLAKTTAFHAAGTTQDVKLMWGDKGAEVPGTADRDTVQAFNRNDDIGADTEVHIARVGPGWEILRSGSTISLGRGCGDCSNEAGTLTVDLGGGLMAATHYRFSPICGGLLPITFEWDTGNTWIGGPGDLLVSCDDEGETEVTATLVISGVEIGDVVITIDDGTNTWTWENDTAFFPNQPMAMRRVSGPLDCPCTTWLPYPCLNPMDV